jgi:hypothetical protein
VKGRQLEAEINRFQDASNFSQAQANGQEWAQKVG